jgi:diacylglycerol kinase (ATP)
MADSRESFSLGKRLKSFRHAFRGLAQLVKREHNFRIHLVVTILVVIAGILLNIKTAEWLIIIIIIGVVLVAEGLNSAVEHLCDILSPDEDQRVKKIKDMLAAAVLISAVIAVIIGIIIFLPHILALILQ